MQRTGHCLCGAVTYTAKGMQPRISACHCEMCRRWASGVYFAARSQELAWAGEDRIQTFTSSKWAERGFCTVCGSALFYRITAPGPMQGATMVAFGTLDDTSGFELGTEWFIDKKPAAYGFAGERDRHTEAEVFAMFAAASGSEG